MESIRKRKILGLQLQFLRSAATRLLQSHLNLCNGRAIQWLVPTLKNSNDHLDLWNCEELEQKERMGGTWRCPSVHLQGFLHSFAKNIFKPVVFYYLCFLALCLIQWPQWGLCCLSSGSALSELFVQQRDHCSLLRKVDLHSLHCAQLTVNNARKGE